ncbi:MOSC domain-containing protein, partial [Candidatus Pelagibacter ubique]|nr:MOSC domain-containing protein [Candidatus Pelagibacter ubique]
VNSISLLNVQSINDFEKKTNKKIEASIFRGNICIDGIKPWKEREWIGKIIKINNVSFKVEKNIPRCVAINLKPQTDDSYFNFLQSLKKIYNHFDMGIYLTALNDGKIEVGNKLEH